MVPAAVPFATQKIVKAPVAGCNRKTGNTFINKLSEIHRNPPTPHVNTSVIAGKSSEDAMTKTADTDTRTKTELAWLQDDRAIAHEVRLALVSDTGHLKAPRKELARHAHCSHRTVEKWTDREVPTLPGLAPFLRMVPHSPALQKMLRRLMTLDADIDPEYQRAFMDFVRAVQNGGQQ